MTDAIRLQKKELRKKILALRDALTPEERQEKSAAIHRHLFTLPEFVRAHSVALFVSFKSEVLTGSMIRGALALSKVVVVPRTDRAGRKLLFFPVNDYPGDLVTGTWGILEPPPHRANPVALKGIDLVVTPGAVFDRRGGRVGYGGGFYDGLLKSFHKPSVALAFAAQLVEEVPAERNHDEPVDIIITEDGIIRCKR